jgi:UDP-N-acetylmuramoyl-L-alanyl-D-glutamate--2,6-diaminopimelate ligase
MKLSDLLKTIDGATMPTTCADIEIASITDNSAEATKGALFAAVRGTQTDGHRYIADAIQRGASAILVDDITALKNVNAADTDIISVKDSAQTLGSIASAFYGHPSRKLRLVGVTGTNGKTTTATLLWQLFERMGYRCGLISTVVYRIHEQTENATHTTPSAICINQLLKRMVDAGCQYCFMEVSSHSVVQKRIAGLHFSGGIFTNLTHDHLDYHKTFAEYLQAKKGFFDALPSDAFALTNIDDRNGNIAVQNTAARRYTYALRSAADFKCRIIEQQMDGTLLNINGTELWTPLIGEFNAYNLCGVYGASLLLTDLLPSMLTDVDVDVDVDINADADTGKERAAAILQHISALTGAVGRFERIAKNGITGIVDYAHTPDALQNVLDTANKLLTNAGHSGALITVVGCGGDRDRTKRPVMAQIAARHSTRAILTSDNPRTEDPQAILDDMSAGLNAEDMKRVLVVADRRSAIRTAATLARSGDIVLVAGKGHEDYQIVGKTKRHFDDREELQQALEEVGR